MLFLRAVITAKVWDTKKKYFLWAWANPYRKMPFELGLEGELISGEKYYKVEIPVKCSRGEICLQ